MGWSARGWIVGDYPWASLFIRPFMLVGGGFFLLGVALAVLVGVGVAYG